MVGREELPLLTRPNPAIVSATGHCCDIRVSLDNVQNKWRDNFLADILDVVSKPMQIGNKIIPPYHHDQDRQNDRDPSSVEEAAKQFKLASASMVIKDHIQDAQREGWEKRGNFSRCPSWKCSHITPIMQDFAVSEISNTKIFSQSLFGAPVWYHTTTRETRIFQILPLAPKFLRPWLTQYLKQFSFGDNARIIVIIIVLKDITWYSQGLVIIAVSIIWREKIWKLGICIHYEISNFTVGRYISLKQYLNFGFLLCFADMNDMELASLVIYPFPKFNDKPKVHKKGSKKKQQKHQDKKLKEKKDPNEKSEDKTVTDLVDHDKDGEEKKDPNVKDEDKADDDKDEKERKNPGEKNKDKTVNNLVNNLIKNDKEEKEHEDNREKPKMKENEEDDERIKDEKGGKGNKKQKENDKESEKETEDDEESQQEEVDKKVKDNEDNEMEGKDSKDSWAEEDASMRSRIPDASDEISSR